MRRLQLDWVNWMEQLTDRDADSERKVALAYYMEGDSTDVILLRRRDLSAIYLIIELINAEMERVKQYAELPIPARYALMRQPTTGYLWSLHESAMNDFNEKFSEFDAPIRNIAQVARVVRMLRVTQLVFCPWIKTDATYMGDYHTLVPKSETYRLYNQLITQRGRDPRDWPDTLPYNYRKGRADWGNAQDTGRP